MVSFFENATHLILTGKPNELDTLVDDLKFQPHGFFYSVKYQQFQVTGGKEGWDGYIRPLMRINTTSCKILRGRKEDLIRLCGMNKFPVNLDRLLPYPFADLQIDDVSADLIAGDFKLDLNQRQCICDWLIAGIGFTKATVGSGKTAMFGGAAALIKQHYPDARFIYFTPSERLVKQSTREMRKFLPHFDIGQCGGGYKEFGAKDMVVCTTAMLNKHFNKLRADGWFDTFTCILADEVHHCHSKTAKQVILSIPAYFRLGASDTSKEKDVSKFNEIRGLFGPMLNDIKAAPLIVTGRLAKPHIYIVDNPGWAGRFNSVPFRPDIGSKAYALLESTWMPATYAGPVYEMDAKGVPVVKSVKTAEKDGNGEWISKLVPVTVPGLHRLNIREVEHEIESRWCLLERLYDKAVIQFKSRNALIVEWAKFFSSKGWSTVVVATRTTHVYILESLLKKALPADKVNILVGDDSPNARDEMFEWFKTNPGSVLVSPLIKEGVSINQIRAMIVADCVADAEVARQIIGRAMRQKSKEDNRAHIVFFWDRQHVTLNQSSRKLFEQLEQIDGFSFWHPCVGPETVFTADSSSKAHE